MASADLAEERRSWRRLARQGQPAPGPEAQRRALEWSRGRRVSPLAVLAGPSGLAAIALAAWFHEPFVVYPVGAVLFVFGAAQVVRPVSGQVHLVNLAALARTDPVREPLHLLAAPRSRLPLNGPTYVALALSIAAGAVSGAVMWAFFLTLLGAHSLFYDRSGHRRPRLPVHLDDYGLHLPAVKLSAPWSDITAVEPMASRLTPQRLAVVWRHPAGDVVVWFDRRDDRPEALLRTSLAYLAR